MYIVGAYVAYLIISISLTIWAECATARACALADRIVSTIDILPDR